MGEKGLDTSTSQKKVGRWSRVTRFSQEESQAGRSDFRAGKMKSWIEGNIFRWVGVGLVLGWVLV